MREFWLRKRSWFCVVAVCVCAFLLSACARDKGHTYNLPDDVVYTPERGFHRLGTPTAEEQENAFRDALQHFNRREYRRAQDLFRTLRKTDEWLDGPRALDAIMLEAISALEAGRSEPGAWYLDELLNAYFYPDEGRPESLASAYPGLTSELVETVDSGEFRELAEELSSAGAIEASWRVTSDIFEYYGAGLGALPGRFDELSRRARNLAYLAWLGDEDGLCQEICKNLRNRGIQGWIRARVEITLAKSLDRDGIRLEASDAYKRAAEATRNTTLVEESLLGEIQALMDSSKGWQYDKGIYEQALRKINEYKANFLVRAGTGVSRLASEFYRLEQEAHNALYNQYLEAADTYRRLGAPNSAELVMKKAEAFRELALKQQERLKQVVESQGKLHGSQN